MSLNVPTFLNFVLLGDFNVDMANQSHLLYHKVCSLLDYFRFSQIVTDYTHTAPNGSNSLIDLVLTTSPCQVFRCVTIPPLDNPTAKSYHLGLCLNIDWKPPGTQGSHSRRRTVWRYAHADFEKASRMISETDWDALFSEDVDLYCIQWQQTFYLPYSGTFWKVQIFVQMAVRPSE